MQGLKGLLADLDALFGAQIARQEEEAADDLAISLRADRRLAEVLTSDAFALVVNERTVPVERVGRDFVQCGEFVAPFDRSHFIACSNGGARAIDLSFVECLRSLARGRATVEFGLGDRILQGVLSSVGADHAIARARTGSVVVPLGSISWVKFSPEDSAGVS